LKEWPCKKELITREERIQCEGIFLGIKYPWHQDNAYQTPKGCQRQDKTTDHLTQTTTMVKTSILPSLGVRPWYFLGRLCLPCETEERERIEDQIEKRTELGYVEVPERREVRREREPEKKETDENEQEEE